jgi:hypothetical protein
MRHGASLARQQAAMRSRAPVPVPHGPVPLGEKMLSLPRYVRASARAGGLWSASYGPRATGHRDRQTVAGSRVEIPRRVWPRCPRLILHPSCLLQIDLTSITISGIMHQDTYASIPNTDRKNGESHRARVRRASAGSGPHVCVDGSQSGQLACTAA